MRTKLFFCFLPPIIWFSSCVYDPSPDYITIINHSDSAVYYCASCKDSLDPNLELKLFWKGNESKNSKNALEWDSPNYRINAYKIQKMPRIINFSDNCDICCPNNDRFNFFFVTEATLRKYSWKEICDSSYFAKKYVLSKHDLQINNWTLHYYP